MEQREQGEIKVVYHYTSMEALLEIVKTKSLWATAISYLNDMTEREYVLDAVRRRLPSFKRSGPDGTEELFVSSVPVEDVEAITPLANEQFVTSFSSHPDSLMHWRSYCPQQSGVAIGFRTQCLAGARLDETPLAGMVVAPSTFGKIRYVDLRSESEVDGLITATLQIARSRFQADSSEKNWYRQSFSLSDYFEWTLEAIACRSKHSSFENEAEYRLLLPGLHRRENNLRFRAVRSTLIPFVAMRVPSIAQLELGEWSEDVPWDAIAELTIGPTVNIALTERSIRSFFLIRHMNVTVRRSSVPYRDW